MGVNQIDIFRGDSITIDRTVTDINGDPVPIEGWIIWFTVRDRLTLDDITAETTDTNAVISKKIEVFLDPANGSYRIVLNPADTKIDPKVYIYDIQGRNLTGQIITIDKDYFNVKSDVTQSTT